MKIATHIVAALFLLWAERKAFAGLVDRKANAA